MARVGDVEKPPSSVSQAVQASVSLSQAEVDWAAAELEAQRDAAQDLLVFKATDTPSGPALCLFAFQQVMVCISGVISMPLLIAKLVCAELVPLAKVLLIGTMLFVSGIATLLQVTLGTRLPLFQGANLAFFPAIEAFMAQADYRCTPANASTPNASLSTEWMERVGVIQGSLMAASAVQVLIGLTGIIGILTRFIGPLTIAPLMVLLELSVVKALIRYLTSHWFSVVVLLLLLLMALYLHGVHVPIPVYRGGRCTSTSYKLFACFPYLLAIVTSWVVCLILTEAEVFYPTDAARTDGAGAILRDAPWFAWPYPGQFGPMGFSPGLFLGFAAATIASVIESVGDYYACGRVCGESTPPGHAVNRGIAMEGLGCLVSGALGGAAGVTTYSENIGAMGITGVASRSVLQAAGVLMILLGLFTKVGALFATLPDPIIGGVLTLSLSMVGGVGLSSIQLLDLKLSRNVAILGFAIIVGVIVPEVVSAPDFAFATGSSTLDDALKILLTIEMFVGGAVGFFLDNTVPGASRAQRGLRGGGVGHSDDAEEPPSEAYDFSPAAKALLAKAPCLSRLPFMPKLDS